MGSVIDYIECPNCTHEAFSDFYYKTCEEYISCNNCGYHKSVTLRDRTKRLDELTENDWEVIELKNPYGSYRIKGIGEIGTQCGSLDTEQQYIDLKESIIGGWYFKNIDNIEFCTVSRLVDGDIVTETII